MGDCLLMQALMLTYYIVVSHAVEGWHGFYVIDEGLTVG